MTLTTTTRVKRYNGNDATTTWPYNFRIDDADHLTVSVYDASAGTLTEISAGLYTVTGIGNDDGGNVEYPLTGSPLTPDDTIIILRTVPYTQPLNISAQGGFNPEVEEANLDFMEMQIQQLSEISSRVWIAPIQEEAGGTITSGDEGDTAIFDADGNIIGGPSASDISGAQSYAAAAAASQVAAAASQTAAEAAETAAEAILASMTLPDPAVANTMLVRNSGNTEYEAKTFAQVRALLSLVDAGRACCRVTLASGDPVPSADQTAKTNIYLTPYEGNVVWVISSGIWIPLTFTELTLATTAFTASKPHDLFVYDDGGSMAVEALPWTDTTTRATTITLTDGVPTKTGDTTRRLIGSVYVDGSKEAADSTEKRHVWNAVNRRHRPLRRIYAEDMWLYNTATMRIAHNNTDNKVSVFRGLNEDGMGLKLKHSCLNSTTTPRYCYIGIGINSTTAKGAAVLSPYVATNSDFFGNASAEYDGQPGEGLYDFNWLEQGAGADNQTWHGDSGGTVQQNGLSGWCLA